MNNFWTGKRRWLQAGVLSLLIIAFLSACAFPVRQAYKVDHSIPMGRIDGDWFIGQRYPFKIKIPKGWQATSRYPEFLVGQGYNRESLEANPVFLFNPQSQSSMQLDFSPAGRTVRFTQETIDTLTRAGAGGLVAELRQEHGKSLAIKLSKGAPLQLKGVPYAARMWAEFTLIGEAMEQGWVYAFAEPFQIFILYLITDKDRLRDQEALEEALSSFEYLGIR